MPGPSTRTSSPSSRELWTKRRLYQKILNWWRGTSARRARNEDDREGTWAARRRNTGGNRQEPPSRYLDCRPRMRLRDAGRCWSPGCSAGCPVDEKDQHSGPHRQADQDRYRGILVGGELIAIMRCDVVVLVVHGPSPWIAFSSSANAAEHSTLRSICPDVPCRPGAIRPTFPSWL